MSTLNPDLENILLSDNVYGDDDINSEDCELEALLICSEEGDGEIYAADKHLFISPPLHEYQTEYSSGESNSISLHHIDCLSDSANDHARDNQRSIVRRNDDSDCGEEDRASILSLARILSESDDEDFDLESIYKDESTILMENSSLGIAQSSGPDVENRQYIGPLNTLVLSQKVAPHPTKVYSYISLDDIVSRVPFATVVTAVYVNLSFICIGTSKGCVTLYSNDKRNLKTLNHSDLSAEVTVIGVSNVRNCLVCGYDSGIIAIWDIQESAQDNQLLMFIDDLHFSPLRFLNVIYKTAQKNSNDGDRFVSFVSSDSSGATYRVCIMKSIFTKYSYESECLLPSKVKSTTQTQTDDRSSTQGKKESRIGDIISLGVLPAPTFPAPLERLLKMELMAFSTHSSTFIVQLRPKVLILHKWSMTATLSVPHSNSQKEKGTETEKERKKPDEREMEKVKDEEKIDERGTVKEREKEIEKETEHKAATDKNSTSEKSTHSSANQSSTAHHLTDSMASLSLDWSWSRTDTPSHPLLLRSTGQSIQVLRIALNLDYPENTGNGDKNMNAFTFDASQHILDASCIFAARWVSGDGNSIAVISENDVLLFSYPDYGLTEKIPLLPDMMAALTLRNRSNVMYNTKHSDMSWCGSYSNDDIKLVFEGCGENFYFFPLSLSGRRESSSSACAALSSTQPLCYYRIERTGKMQCTYEGAVLSLVQQGKWLEALGLCIQSQSRPLSQSLSQYQSGDDNDDKKNGQNGGGDDDGDDDALDLDESLSKNNQDSTLSMPSSDELSFFESMIKKYTMIAVYKHSYFIASDYNGVKRKRALHGFEGRGGSTTQSNSHYHLAAQVCIQYCVALGLMDVLYGDLYEMFRLSGQEAVFLKTVAGHIASIRPLNSLLQTLPLHIVTSMERVAEESSYSAGLYSVLDFQLLEKCVLALNMTAQEIKYGSCGIPDMMLRRDLLSGFLHSYSSATKDFAAAFRLAFKHYESKYSVRAAENNGQLECSSEDPPTPYTPSSSLSHPYSSSSSYSYSYPYPHSYSFSYPNSNTSSPRFQVHNDTPGRKLLIFLANTLSSNIAVGNHEKTSSPSHHILELLEEVILNTPPTVSTTPPSYISKRTTSNATSSSSCGDIQRQDTLGVEVEVEVEVEPFKYLQVLAQIDSETLIRSLSVGIRSVALTQPKEIISQLYVSLFKFVTDFDTKNKKEKVNEMIKMEEIKQSKGQNMKLSMTECFFSNFENDLLCHTSSLLPLDIILSLLRYLSLRSNDDNDVKKDPAHSNSKSNSDNSSNSNNDNNSSSISTVESAACHIIITELTHTAPPGNPIRRDAVLQCLTECNLWRAVLLLQTGYCNVLGGVTHVFDEVCFMQAMQYYTTSSSSSSSSSSSHSSSSSSSSSPSSFSLSSSSSSAPPPPSSSSSPPPSSPPPSSITKNKHIEVFQYLKLCNQVVVEEVTLQTLRISSKGTVDWLPVYGYFSIHDERIKNTPNNLPNFEIFKKCLSRYLVALSSIDLEELKRAVCVLFLHDDALLIPATECSRTIQFELLSSLLNHVLNSRQAAIIEGCDVMSLPVITQSIFVLYIGLLIVERPFLLFSYLIKCRKCCHPIPADECLVLCSDALTVHTPHTQDRELCIVKEQDRGQKERQEKEQKEGGNEGQEEGRQVEGGQKERQEIQEGREIGGQIGGQKDQNNQNQWILLDSISLLKETKSDIMGALSAIVDYIAHASKDERKVVKWEMRNTERKEGIEIITNNNNNNNNENNENNDINHNKVKNDNDRDNNNDNINDTVRNEDYTGRLVHGVQCLVRLCIVGSKEGKEKEDSKGNKENKERSITQSDNNNNHSSSSSSSSGSNSLYGLWFTAMDRLLPLLGE
jgi:hypothetical protein